jgi:NAD(P)-dependent dehydrogenase (short-subunit alcohol dehydrogenase family)
VSDGRAQLERWARRRRTAQALARRRWSTPRGRAVRRARRRVTNAASLATSDATVDLALEDRQESIDTNLTGAFLGAKNQVPAMLQRGGGSLIFTSSFVGNTVGFPGKAAYDEQGRVIGLVKTLAVELRPRGIRAKALRPGGTNTAMYEAFATTDEARAAVRALIALERVAQPEEIAHSALYM